MVIALVIIICVLLMALFMGVTIAGGKAHDRQNAARVDAERRRAEDKRRAGNGDPPGL